MKISIKKCHPNARIPQYQTKGAAGFDFHAVLDENNPCFFHDPYLNDGKPCYIIGAKSQGVIPTGLMVAIPEGYELQVRPRSGLALKHSITVTNAPGTIDSDWRGNCQVILFNLGEKVFIINDGDRIAQGVINKIEQAEFEEVENLDETDRGDKGFGSTGHK